MLTVTKFEDLGTFNNDWLDAHYHFSFAGYHDPKKMGFGPLRVWNDDTVNPHSGFEPHPHKDMEIITYVRTGAITHKDNLGNEGVTRAGDVQVMHAGTGIVHSEHNLEDEATTLFQIWILPDARGHQPGWQARKFPKQPTLDALPALASGRPQHPDALPIHQDASVHGGRLTAGTVIRQPLGQGRGAYLVASEGTLRVGGETVPPRGAAQISAVDAIEIEAVTDAEIVLVDVALG